MESQGWVHGALLWLRAWDLTTRAKVDVRGRRRHRPRKRRNGRSHKHEGRAAGPGNGIRPWLGTEEAGQGRYSLHWALDQTDGCLAEDTGGALAGQTYHRDADSGGRRPSSSTYVPAWGLLGDGSTLGSGVQSSRGKQHGGAVACLLVSPQPQRSTLIPSVMVLAGGGEVPLGGE